MTKPSKNEEGQPATAPVEGAVVFTVRSTRAKLTMPCLEEQRLAMPPLTADTLNSMIREQRGRR
jgi:hypothetical protein